MGENEVNQDRTFLRAGIITSEHPSKPLEGTVVMMITSHDLDRDLDEEYFEVVMSQPEERYDIEKYAHDLLLGTLYFDADEREFKGVCWEDEPIPYEHGDLEDPVNDLPEGLVPTSQL